VVSFKNVAVLVDWAGIEGAVFGRKAATTYEARLSHVFEHSNNFYVVVFLERDVNCSDDDVFSVYVFIS
jgi:hypothetical protein